MSIILPVGAKVLKVNYLVFKFNKNSLFVASATISIFMAAIGTVTIADT